MVKLAVKASCKFTVLIPNNAYLALLFTVVTPPAATDALRINFLSLSYNPIYVLKFELFLIVLPPTTGNIRWSADHVVDIVNFPLVSIKQPGIHAVLNLYVPPNNDDIIASLSIVKFLPYFYADNYKGYYLTASYHKRTYI